jgi:hypothetical protein
LHWQRIATDSGGYAQRGIAKAKQSTVMHSVGMEQQCKATALQAKAKQR